ncbi:MAG: hypothetical protein ABGX43_03365 [Nitrospinaceae bacterium]
MKRRPTVTETDLPAPTGVTKKKITVQHQSQKGKSYTVHESFTTSITDETPAKLVKEILGEKIGSSCDDLLKDMEKKAVSVLKEANLPTERQVTRTTTNDGTLTKIKFPMGIAENKYGKFSDEYHAAAVLSSINFCRQDIEKNEAESAVRHTLQATYHFHQLMIDQRAYAIGLDATHDPKLQDWVTRAKRIMTDKRFTTEQLLSKSRLITFGKLSIWVADDQAKDGLDPDNEDSIRQSLAAYFK